MSDKPKVTIRNPEFLPNGQMKGTVWGHPKYADGTVVTTSLPQKVTTYNTKYTVERE